MATGKKVAKKSAISVDFSDTEASGVLEEGDYLLEIDEVEQKTSDNSGADYLSFTFKVAEGEFKNKKVWHNCSLQPQALFNLRGLLEALGYEVPQGVMELNPQELVGEQCAGSIVHEKYEGKTKARVAEFFLASELGEGGEEEAEPEVEVKKPTGKAPAKKPVEKEPDPAPETTGKKKVVKKVAKKELEVGATVEFTDDDGEVHEGEVTAMADGNVTVLVGEDEWELSEGDVTVK